MRVSQVLVTAVLLLGPTAPPAKAGTLAPTPPMGWDSWNKFGCDVSEKLVRETADAMAANGMMDAGYQYVVIDDCWQVKRDEKGRIVADAERFSSGMKALADYVHGSVGELWRTTGDIPDCWDCGKSWGGMGVVHIIDLNAELHPYAGTTS